MVSGVHRGDHGENGVPLSSRPTVCNKRVEVTAVVLGWVWLGQAMTGWSLLGLVLVFGSILTVQWASAPKK